MYIYSILNKTSLLIKIGAGLVAAIILQLAISLLIAHSAYASSVTTVLPDRGEVGIAKMDR